MFYKGTILCGCSARDKVTLDKWRRKYSIRTLPNNRYGSNNGKKPYTAKAQTKYDEKWYELYCAGWRQTDIAKHLGVSNAYVSVIKRRYRAKGLVDTTL